MKKVIIFLVVIINISVLFGIENKKTELEEMLIVAQNGNHKAEFIIGFSYLTGNFKNFESVEIDNEKAVYWITLASEGNYDYAQFYLGGMYNEGKGVEKNIDLAAKWFLLAAQNGNILARINIGAFFYYGRGVIKDINKAYAWASLAAYEQNENAKKLVQLILPNIINRDRANTLAGEYFSKYGLSKSDE